MGSVLPRVHPQILGVDLDLGYNNKEEMAEMDYNRRNKVPRPLTESEKARLEEFIDSIHYSAR